MNEIDTVFLNLHEGILVTQVSLRAVDGYDQGGDVQWNFRVTGPWQRPFSSNKRSSSRFQMFRKAETGSSAQYFGLFVFRGRSGTTLGRVGS